MTGRPRCQTQVTRRLLLPRAGRDLGNHRSDRHRSQGVWIPSHLDRIHTRSPPGPTIRPHRHPRLGYPRAVTVQVTPFLIVLREVILSSGNPSPSLSTSNSSQIESVSVSVGTEVDTTGSEPHRCSFSSDHPSPSSSRSATSPIPSPSKSEFSEASSGKASPSSGNPSPSSSSSRLLHVPSESVSWG